MISESNPAYNPKAADTVLPFLEGSTALKYLDQLGNGMRPMLQEDYSEFVASRAKKLESPILDLHHATTGMSGECGEALDATKKLWIYNKPLTPEVEENLIEEAGDCLFYIQHLCNILHCTLADLILYNMKKLTVRYPQGYSDKAAQDRADKAQ